MTNQHQHRASININDDVKVKLTDSGRDVLAMQQLRRQQDADGYIKFQLWELMNVFGSYVYNGCSIPFTFNRILLAPFDSAMTDQHQHRATPEQWAKVKGYAPGLEVCSCLIELRDRIEALEATQHAHAITGPTDQLHSYKVGPAEPVEDWGKGHTQVRQHRATPEQWAFTENRGVGDPVYATCSCILELRDRIQQLESSQPPRLPAPAPSPRPSSLVDRVIHAINPSLTPIFRSDRDEARAAIREVAEWLRSEYPLLTLGTAAWANLLDNEANR